MASLASWWEAVRPKTLWAGVCPILWGAGIASLHNVINIPLAIITLLCAVGIQIGTNLANDYFDYVKGSDKNRVGPRRATQSGLISPSTMKRAYQGCFALTFLLGIICIYHGGLSIFIIGVISLLCGYAYTGGPFPLAYNGLGDLFVLIFFGPVAVAGTAYLQTGTWMTDAIILGLIPGLICVGILVVNNIRDHKSDTQNNKNTTIVIFGTTFGKWLYAICMLSSIGILTTYLFSKGVFWPLSTLPLFVLPLVIWLCLQVTQRNGSTLNPILGKTAQFLLIYTLLFLVIIWTQKLLFT